jgi:23S rRNA (cytidine1920-2'-O)/16S rRNA (cytidine1409-2'-O)-methyltransferase
MAENDRADIFLVVQGFAETRAEAQAAIRAGCVHADGERVVKSSQPLRSRMKIKYERAHPYVSRGGVKLAAALKKFGYSAAGRVCLDIGASTGGFTQVLLQDGAVRVYAVDVGHNQLSRELVSDPRLVSLEGLNARDLSHALIHEPIDAIVADVSFISLKLALPSSLSRASKNAWAVLLVKPQFEAGRDHVDKGGIVKSKEARVTVANDMIAWIKDQDWYVEGIMQSPITGADGNQEYLLAARRN